MQSVTYRFFIGISQALNISYIAQVSKQGKTPANYFPELSQFS